MFKKIKKSSEFTRNVFTLMFGTTIAQAIPIAVSPILTRIYTPEDFGVFAIFASVSAIISVFATGRYENAIILPEKDEDAANIVVLVIIFSFLVSTVVFLLFLLFDAQFSALLGISEGSNVLIFVPISILLTGTYLSLNYWYIRGGRYKTLAFNRVNQTVSTSATNIGFGVSGFANIGLVLGTVVGQCVATLRLAIYILKGDGSFGNIKKKRMCFLAKKYRNFPKFDIMSSLFNVASQHITPILFNMLFSTVLAGYYFFVIKILNLPLMIVSGAVGDVFKEKASKDYYELGSAKAIYLLTLKRLFLIGLIPSVVLYFFIVDLFEIIFGQNWSISGEFAQILIPMIFLRFVVSPLTYVFYIANKQNINLLGQLFLFLFTLVSFYVGYITNDSFVTVYFISFFYSIFYLLNLYISYHLCERKG